MSGHDFGDIRERLLSVGNSIDAMLTVARELASRQKRQVELQDAVDERFLETLQVVRDLLERLHAVPELVTKLSEVQAGIDPVGNAVSHVDEGLSTLGIQLSEVRTAMNDVRSAAQEERSFVHLSLGNLEKSSSSMSEAVKEASADIDALKVGIFDFTSSLTSDLGEFHRQMNEMGRQTGEIVRMQQKLDAKLLKNERQLDEVKRSQNQFNQQLASIVSLMQKVANSVEAVEAMQKLPVRKRGR